MNKSNTTQIDLRKTPKCIICSDRLINYDSFNVLLNENTMAMLHKKKQQRRNNIKCF